MPPRSVMSVLPLLAVLAGCASAPTGAPGSGPASPPSSAPAGPPSPASSAPARPALPSLQEIQGRWWTWAATEGEATSPLSDTTGERCARNQPDDLWFLAGTSGGLVRRTCVVPAGRPLVFPLVNRIADEPTCREFMATAQGRAVLDGTAVPTRSLSDPDTIVTGTEDNAVTGEEGTYRVHGCGIWARLPPLPAGRHTLTIRGSSGDFKVGVDYTLVVEPGPSA
ncbi:signal protein [Sphaerisporangium aureirubrum]|uniref:Signal protein n=1 Tax=Sphaerisporangium aureirubrum TaxID=1544736 RepID=A0ABW1NCA7_9ACTN